MIAARPRGLRVAVAVKQVPLVESLGLMADGRLRRHGVPLEMNPYCRRALAQGVELARETGGRCTVVSLGPPTAADMLREALAWGADAAILLTDPVFAGSDTLATARALAALLRREGPFDLLLVGRNSVDADTGQVGPALAALLELPFAGAVRELEWDGPGDRVRVRCERDDGWGDAVVGLPAVLAVAERLCPPAKVAPERWRAVPPERVRRVGPDQLDDTGPWGQAGSPTAVGAVREVAIARRPVRLEGPLPQQVRRALDLLGAVDGLGGRSRRPSRAVPHPHPRADRRRAVAVLLEPGRSHLAAELLGRAAVLARGLGGQVVGVTPAMMGSQEAWALGADELVWIVGAAAAEDIVAALEDWVRGRAPWAILGPATSWGREVLARAAARLGAGLIGDAVDVHLEDGRLVGWKPALGGGLLARITASSAVQAVTLRPGALPPLRRRLGARSAAVTRLAVRPGGRIEIGPSWRDDHSEALGRARSVVGVGAGVAPDGYPVVRRLAQRLGAELAATRKVTDQGWMPRFRQVGITGRFIAPQLYVAVGVRGKLNHMLGVGQARTILAINRDPDAPVFGRCDIGIVGDWREAVTLLAGALAARGSG